MVKIGTLVRLEAKPGNETDIERALQKTFARVQEEPTTTAWFALRLGPSTFGTFAAFPDEKGLQAHFSDETRARIEQANTLLARPRIMEQVDVLAAKLPAPGATDTVTVGFLIRYEAKPGNENEVERGLKGALSVIQEEPATTAWFALRLGPSTFGVFDAFPNEAGRQAHYNAGWPQLQAIASQLFVEGSLTIEKVDIIAAKLPG